MDKENTCNVCGARLSTGAKKCTACGEEVWVPSILRSVPVRFLWKLLATVVSVSYLFVAFILWQQGENLRVQTEITKRRYEIENIPVLRVGIVTLNAAYYQESPETQSVILNFSIPITNKHGFAQDIRIVKKNLNLIRGEYDLSERSLQSQYTKMPFDLSQGETVYDKILIDESPQNFAKYMRGEKTFTLEYEIHYKALPEVTKDTYIFHYKVALQKGAIEVLEQRTERMR